MDEDETRPPRAWRRPVALGLATVLVAGGGYLAWAARQPGEAKFCWASQGFTVLDDGRTAEHQAGGPDPVECAGPDRRPGTLVLGLDCKVREGDGTVVTTLPAGSPGCAP